MKRRRDGLRSTEALDSHPHGLQQGQPSRMPMELLRGILFAAFRGSGAEGVRVVVTCRVVCKRWCALLGDPSFDILYHEIFETTTNLKIPPHAREALPTAFGPLFWVHSSHFCCWIARRKALLQSFEIVPKLGSSFLPPLPTDLLLIAHLGLLGVLSSYHLKSYTKMVTSTVLPKGILKLREQFISTKKHRSLDLTQDEQQFITFKTLLDSSNLLYHDSHSLGDYQRTTTLFTILGRYAVAISSEDPLRAILLSNHTRINRLYWELSQELSLRCTQKQFYEFIGEVCGGYEDYWYISSTHLTNR